MSDTKLRCAPPKIPGERVAHALIAAYRRLANPANFSPRGYAYHQDGEPVMSTQGLCSPGVRAGLLETIDIVCGEDLNLQVAACAALCGARDALQLPHNLRGIDRSLGLPGVRALLDSAIRHARRCEWDGHPPLTPPPGAPSRADYEALCLIAQLLEEIHLASEPCAGRHDATWSINEHAEGELRDIERYLHEHHRRVHRLQRAERRRQRFAGGPRALITRAVRGALAHLHLGRAPRPNELPF